MSEKEKEKNGYQLWRSLPAVDSLLREQKCRRLINQYGQELVVSSLRHVLQTMRDRIKEEPASLSAADLSKEKILDQAEQVLNSQFQPSLRRVINATGVIIHTGLGRAVFSPEAIAALNQVLAGPCSLAIDLETGRRGDRDTHLNDLLTRLTGAEAATVVNNNAAATLLILNTLAKGREVIVSRGQLVEIGGSFRLPEVMAMSGAVLREIETTNKTHLYDYERAINESTAAILRVHHSNYKIMGFTAEPSLAELVALGKKHNLPVIDDLGSGALVDLAVFGLEPEPMVQKSVRAGASLVCFSGDKLLGGPQAGIIVGNKELIHRLKKNPLKRALRVDKMVVAAMEATLRLFLLPEKLKQKHPVYRMFSFPEKEIKQRVRRFQRRLQTQLPSDWELESMSGGTEVGSGSVPAQTLPTWLLAIRSKRFSPEVVARKLRLAPTPVITRIHEEAVLLDFRTILPEEERRLEENLISSLLSLSQEEASD